MRTRPTRPARPAPKKCYDVRVHSFMKELRIEIHEATIIKETEHFYMVEPELRYRSRIAKESAVTDLKAHLHRLKDSRYITIDRLENEIELLEAEIDKL